MDRQPDLILDNGLKIFYEHDVKAAGTNFTMVVNSQRDIPADQKDLYMAANHLLEHCVRAKPHLTGMAIKLMLTKNIKS